MENSLILGKFESAAKRAYNNTSFSPERRGEQMIKEYSAELTEDMTELSKNENVTPEQIEDYKNRYERFFSSYLSAKSRCFSVMITGAGNFPVRKHEKANRSEERHYEIFREWRERAKKAIVRKSQPVKTYATELDRYKADLVNMQRNHELMKEGNKRISKANKTGEDLTAYLTDVFNIVPHMIEWTLKHGFYLQNSNANIKRVEQRIKELEAKENARTTKGNQDHIFEGGKVVFNYEIDRIQILHDQKPSPDTIKELKSNGFKWAPSQTAWQRQLTQNAIYATKQFLKTIAAKTN